METKIVPLEKERWKGYVLPMPDYTATEHYAVATEKTKNGFNITLTKKPLAAPRVMTPEEYGMPDGLYADHFAAAEAFGIMREGELIAALEICPEEWNNRLRVTELWGKEDFRGCGIGKKLLDFAKSEALRQGRRAIVLETQSCNTRAVAFYLREGFTLTGLDICCYSNQDVARGEVRLELGMLF